MTENTPDEVKAPELPAMISREEAKDHVTGGIWQRVKNKTLYFDDGKKRTINKKMVSLSLLGTFPFMLLLLWIRDLRQSESSSAEAPSGVGLPGQLIQGKIIEIPPLAELNPAQPGVSKPFLHGGLRRPISSLERSDL